METGVNPIGCGCDNCYHEITADDVEATQHYHLIDEDGTRRYVDGVFACCHECWQELMDADADYAWESFAGLTYQDAIDFEGA